MNINSNCFLINCDLAKTMRKMCKVVEVREGAYHKYIVVPHDEPNNFIAVREGDLRAPKAGEVKSLVRLFNS